MLRSSLGSTWPNHHNLLHLTTSATQSSWVLSSLHANLLSKVTQHIYLTIILSDLIHLFHAPFPFFQLRIPQSLHSEPDRQQKITQKEKPSLYFSWYSLSTMTNNSGKRSDAWWTPTLTVKSLLSLPFTLPIVFASLYIAIIEVIIYSSTPRVLNAHHIFAYLKKLYNFSGYAIKCLF